MPAGRKVMDPEARRVMREDRFWSRVEKRGPDECWNWKHMRNRSGYGIFRLWGKADRSKTLTCHRFAYQLAHGGIPKSEAAGFHGTVIAHKCDNRLCCNPAHLFATTQKGNLDDCLAKGRGNKAFGEKAGKAKLAESDVKAIRAAIERGVDRIALSAQYNVTAQAIADIASGKNWRHLSTRRLLIAPAPKDYSWCKPNSGSFKAGSRGNPGPKPERRTADYDAIRALLGSGASYREIARRTGTTHTTVRRVAGG